MTIEPEMSGEPLPDGAYIGLPDDDYFKQERLGSTDLVRLSKRGEGWWWSSRYNPDRIQKQTEAQVVGQALHALLLEGVHHYETRFAIWPERRDWPNAISGVKQMRAALEDAGFSTKGTSAWNAQRWRDEMADKLPDATVWDSVMEDFEKSLIIRGLDGEPIGNRPALDAADDRMLRLMLDLALQEPDVRQILGHDLDTPSLSELAFLWTDDRGVRRRAKFDKPVPTFTMDLKSLGGFRPRDLTESISDHILREGLDIQVGDQHDARKRMYAMLREEGEDCITGGTLQQRAWLMAMAERDFRWDWLWLFYEKPDAAKATAPTIFPVRDAWGGPYHRSGYRKAQRAVDFFVSAVERYGLGEQWSIDGTPARPWARTLPLHHSAPTQDKKDPVIQIGDRGWDETPYDGEDAHFDR